MSKHKESLLIEKGRDGGGVLQIDVATTIATTPTKATTTMTSTSIPTKRKISFITMGGFDVDDVDNKEDGDEGNNKSTVVKEIVSIKKVKAAGGAMVPLKKLKVINGKQEGRSSVGKQVWQQRQPEKRCSFKSICSALLQMCVGVVVIGLLYFQANIATKMLKAFQDSPESFTVDTLK